MANNRVWLTKRQYGMMPQCRFAIGLGGKDMTNKKRLLLWALALISLMIGFIEQGWMSGDANASGLLMVHAVLSIAVIFAWVRLDAKAIGCSRSWPLNLLMVVLTVFALPYYLFKSRGLKAGTVAIAWAMLVFVAVMLAYGAGSVLGKLAA